MHGPARRCVVALATAMSIGAIAGIGAGGAGAASASASAPGGAASSKMKIVPGSKWTVVSAQVFCENVTFHANGAFTSKDGPGGTWTGGRKTLNMAWGGTEPFTFSGTWSRVPLKEYTGDFDGNDQFPGHVEEGTGRC
jgi:hypothetical protein